MKIFEQFQDSARFTGVEQQIIGYMLDHAQEIYNYQIRILAKETHVSTTTILRLCKKLGFKGYTDFRVKFIEEYTLLNEIDLIPKTQLISQNEIISSITKKMAAYTTSAIEDTRLSFDYAQLNRVIKLISQKKTIYFFAFDSNIPLLQTLQPFFMSVGKNCIIPSTDNTQFLQATIMDASDIAIIISKTGYNPRLVEVCKVLKARKVFTILITGGIRETLSRLVSETFYVSINDSFLDLGYFVFISSAQYVLFVLFGALYAKNTEISNEINKTYNDMFFNIYKR